MSGNQVLMLIAGAVSIGLIQFFGRLEGGLYKKHANVCSVIVALATVVFIIARGLR